MGKRFWIIIVVLFLAVAVAVILFLRGRGVKAPFLYPPLATEEVTEGLGSAALEKSKNPLKNELPDNPFEGETNPFEGGTNPIEKSYNNPLK